MQHVASKNVKLLIQKEVGEIERGIQKRKKEFPC